MVVNSWFINGFLTSSLGRSCHSTYLGFWSHIRQGFWLGWKYTEQKPHCLFCDFLCPRATDFSLSAEHLYSISDTVRFFFFFDLNYEIRRIPFGGTFRTFSYWRHHCLLFGLSGDRVDRAKGLSERIFKCLFYLSFCFFSLGRDLLGP